MRFCAILTMVVSAASASAQTHIVGFVAGGSGFTARLNTKIRFAVDHPDVGVSSTIELNRVLAIGTEARYVRKNRDPVGLHYFEAPLFVRLSYPSAMHSARPFIRFGVAPAVEVYCSYAVAKDPAAPNPDTRRVIADPVGYAYHPVPKPQNLARLEACSQARQRKIDFGLLSALGATFRHGLHEFGLEARVTNGLRTLSDNAIHTVMPFRNRNVSLLATSATRVF